MGYGLWLDNNCIHSTNFPAKNKIKKNPAKTGIDYECTKNTGRNKTFLLFLIFFSNKLTCLKNLEKRRRRRQRRRWRGRPRKNRCEREQCNENGARQKNFKMTFG